MPRVLAAALVLAASVAPAVVGAESDPESPITAAIGVKTGMIPPVLAVPEIVLHTPRFFAGVFGIVTSGGMGNGGRRTTLGAEAAYEFDPPGQNTPYLSLSFFRYEADTDQAGFYERSNVLTLTAGYLWKWRHFDLQLGAGALAILGEEKAPPPPCTGFCFNFDYRAPPLLPALDLSARYRF